MESLVPMVMIVPIRTTCPLTTLRQCGATNNLTLVSIALNYSLVMLGKLKYILYLLLGWEEAMRRGGPSFYGYGPDYARGKDFDR